MSAATTKKEQRTRRRKRIRTRVRGTHERPRLSMFRSNRYIYAQVIDDEKGATVAQANARDLHVRGRDAAEAVGRAIADALRAKGVTAVVFDRGGFRYAGAIKRLADTARAAGLEF